MKNPKSLAMIDGVQLMRLARTGVIAEADGLRREVSKVFAALNPAAIVALALSRNPEHSATVALERFKREVAELLDLLSASSDALQAAQRAERQRLACAVAAAAHRTLEIVGDVNRIESLIRSREADGQGKRDRLRKEGLSGAELDRAAAPFDPSELQAERAALLAEQSTLETFLKTRDPQHIPAGFADEVRKAA